MNLQKQIKSNVKQVVFDLGGVLIEWNPQRIVEAFTTDIELQKKVLEQVFLHQDWLELDRGTFLEAFAAEKISKRSGLDQACILDVFEAARDSFDAIEPTEKVLRKLASSGVPCYVLSNMSSENYDYLRGRHSFFECFSGGVISAHEKVIKPDSEIFKRLCNKHQFEPHETLFVDDMPANCLAAEELGFQVGHFNDYDRSSVLLSLERLAEA